ncbi:MAG: 23S rRNA (guanosine(2251)-2'-O)-methyltransferase RlmB [Candidatus Hydrogenedentales bacterium]
MAGKAIYGQNAVQEALRAQGRVNRLYLARDTKVRGLESLIAAAKQADVPFDFVPQAKLNELAETLEHQGVVATVSPVAYVPLEECLSQCAPKALLLVLDQVQNPKNLGLLIRTAMGAGASAVILPERGGALMDDEVVRASAGAVFHIPVAVCGNVSQTLSTLKDCGFWVYALDGSGESDVFKVDWADRTALVLGNETSGIRPGVLKAADVRVRIPLAGGLDSLNVAVASGIALFQASTRSGLI